MAVLAAALRLMSAHRVKPSPTRLKYSICCVNRKYLISSRSPDEIRPAGGGDVCELGGHDNLAAAENDANERGGVGSTCSCDNKDYAYCVNRRIEISKIPPAEMRKQEPGYDEEMCELPDDALSEKPGSESPAEQPGEGAKIKRNYAASCECKNSAAGKESDAKGGSWAFFGLGLAFVATLLTFVRLKQRGEPLEDVFHPDLSK